MKILIEIHLNIEGSRSMSKGEFNVRDSDFKADADFAVGVIAYEWIQYKWRESGCRDLIIDKVIWDEQNDITDLVKQIKPLLPPDDLPF